MSEGVASSKTVRVFLRMLRVVARTRKLKMNVQIGSMRLHSGLKKITIAAMKTPIDWMKSPTTWIKAAETLMFSPNNWRNISTMKMTMMSLTVFLRSGALLEVSVRMAVATT